MAIREVQRPDSPPSDPTPTAAAASPREDLITALFSAALVGGVLTDAWAHTNILDELESFFTPWHGLLYSGFAATAAWTFWLAFLRRGTSRRWWWTAWPAGYLLGAAGAVLFLVAGVADLVWHSIFGIEAGLDAALSPSHLLLVVGGVLLITSPLRSWWANGGTGLRAASAVASAALATVFSFVLLGHVLGLMSIAPTHAYDYVQNSPSHLEAAFGSAKYLITTVIFLIPVLLVYRHRAVFGTATAVVGGVALFALVQFEFPMPQTAAALAATAAAAVVDLIVVRLDAVRGPNAPLRLPIAGALFAALVWSAHLLGLHLAEGIAWPAEMWAGNVVLAAALGTLLGGLAAAPHAGPFQPRTQPEPVPDRSGP